MNEEKRIYCVVAQTVQHPLEVELSPFPPTRRKYVRGKNTRTIVQVPGRITAQVGHAVSKMRYNLLANEIEGASVIALTGRKKLRAMATSIPPFQPITTIVLGARDSFELDHVYALLRDVAGILTYKFNDTNPDVYGEGEVTTAICTVPVPPSEVIGILDYLPLWAPSPQDDGDVLPMRTERSCPW